MSRGRGFSASRGSVSGGRGSCLGVRGIVSMGGGVLPLGDLHPGGSVSRGRGFSASRGSVSGGTGVLPWGEGDCVYGGRGSAFGGSASGGRVQTRPLPRTTRYSQRAGGMQYTRYWNSFLLILSTSQYIMLFLSIQQSNFLCNLILKHQN